MTTLDRKGAVAIAKDMLAQLDAKAIRMTQGTYLSIKTRRRLKGGEQLGEVKIKSCTCCQLGALLLSKARVFDEEVIPEEQGYIDDDGLGAILFSAECERGLSAYFSKLEIGMLESAFEMAPRSEALP